MALGLATNLNGMVGIRSGPTGLDFHLPPELEASMPPESRGLARDQVRLMVSHYSDDRVDHTTFRHLPEFLRSGDLLVINTSGTLNAALPAHREDGSPMLLHLSTRLPHGEWVVEVRQPEGGATSSSSLRRLAKRWLCRAVPWPSWNDPIPAASARSCRDARGSGLPR